MPPGFEPKLVSVRAKQPIVSPTCIPGSQRHSCSSDPDEWMTYIERLPCTETKLWRAASPTASSCLAYTEPHAAA